MNHYIPSLNITVTDEPKLGNLTLEQEQLIQICHEKVLYSSDENTIDFIKNAVKKHPNIPQFQNYLTQLYFSSGNIEKAALTNSKLNEQYPDYLFAKLNKIAFLSFEDDSQTIIELLGGEKHDITSLITDTDVIHISEFMNYYARLGEFKVQQGNIEEAKRCLNLMLEVNDEDNDAVMSLAKLIIAIRFELRFSYREFEQNVDDKPTYILTQTIKRPDLNHKELEILYQYCDNSFPKKEIHKIMALPRETLLDDLENILNDNIARNDFFQIENDENEDENVYFNIHALYFLGALNSERHLQVVLNQLRQGSEFLHHWYGDGIETYFYPTLYALSKNNLDKLFDFICEPNIYSWARTLVVDTAAQVAHHDPERRLEVVQFIKNTIQFLKNNKADHTRFDTRFFNSLIGPIISLRIKELYHEVERMYETNWIDEGFMGTLEDVKKEIHSPYGLHEVDPLPKDIFEYYDSSYLKRRVKNNVNYDELFNGIGESKGDSLLDKIIKEDLDNMLKSQFEDGLQDYEDNLDWDYTPSVPVKSVKIGRNEPCPCGSGKKFKKCCINKPKINMKNIF